MSNRFILFLFFFLVTSVGSAQSPNILLYIVDDVGVAPIPNYAPLNVNKAKMPNLEALMEDGITFDKVWVNPSCSPTRASILTGKYGFRTNVLNPTNLSQIEPEEVTLHEYIDTATNGAYSSALIGKWHLSGNGNTVPNYPEFCGIPYYAGSLSGSVPTYTSWNFTSNGQTSISNTYVTSSYTDLAIDWINGQTKPWFCWLAHNAPHTPFHIPPSEMHSQGNLSSDPDSISNNPLPYFLAMLESTDYELGRLMDSLPQTVLDNTIIIFIGDNGTTRAVQQGPYANYQNKGSLYQGGIHVPMVITGAGISRKNEREDAIINGTDLFSTIVEMTGTVLPSIHDSRSFFPLLAQAGNSIRECAFSEGETSASNSGGWTTRDANFKFISYDDGNEEFYRLSNDPYETMNLLITGLNANQQNAYNRLKACNPKTGTADFSPLKQDVLSVFPNPASTDITVNWQGTSNTAYQIVDCYGRFSKQGFLQKGKQNVALHELPNGIYFLCAGNLRKKIIIQRND